MSFLSDLSYVLFGRGGRDRKMTQMLETWKDSHPSFFSTSFSSLTRQGYRKNELIFACLAKKSGTASQVTLKGMRSPETAVGFDHPFHKLIRRPNRFMNEFDLWGSVMIYQALAGRAIYEKERNNFGEVIALWPLRPDRISIVPSRTNFISHYLYHVPGLPPQPIRVEDVIDFKLFDPLDQYHGYPPVAVASRVGDVDNSATDFIKLFFDKGGVPPGILKTVQRLQDTDVFDIRRRWVERYGGVNNWDAPAVLDRDADYQNIGHSFEQMGFEVLDARNESRICAILRVPPMIVGAKVGLDRSTFTNYKEARLAWWEDDLVPEYSNMGDAIQNQLIELDFPDLLMAEWDFTNVPALREERLSLWQRANEGLRQGGITVNEYRREIGLKPLPTGDIFLRPLNVMPVPISSIASDPEEEDNTQEEEETTSTPDSGESEDVEATEENEKFHLTFFPQVAGKSAPPEFLQKERDKFERKLDARLKKELGKQLKRIESEIKEEYG